MEGFKKRLVRNGSTVRVDESPLQDEFEQAFGGNTDLDKKMMMLS